MRGFKLVCPGAVLMSFLTILLVTGCKKEGNNDASGCYKVRLGVPYCSSSNDVLVYFEKANRFTKSTSSTTDAQSSAFVAVVTNFPRSAYKRDSVVYVQFSYNEQVENDYFKSLGPCVAVFGPARILTFEGVSDQSCVAARLK